MNSEYSDRNLLLGMMALQLEFVSRDQLLDALHAWVANKNKLVTEILADKGYLSERRKKQLEEIVEDRIQENSGDVAKSLAGVREFRSLHHSLAHFRDNDISASLSRSNVINEAGKTDVLHDLVEVDADLFTTQPPLDFTTSRFKRIRPHAEGGLGVVWVAFDNELNREVVVKEIKPAHADRDDTRMQFLLEGEITGGLEHPGIVPVYGMGKYPDGRPYYAMRFIRGSSLRDAIELYHGRNPDRLMGDHQNELELRKLLSRFVDVCHAVAYAHSRCVLHRDLKPDNVMLGKFGETLVVDWGLAEALEKMEAPNNAESEPPLRPLSGSIQTQLGSLIGTVQFMSPEQADGRIDLLNATSDIYCLGATLYNLLTGKPSISIVGDSLAEALQKVRKGNFPRPSHVKRDVPRALEEICLKAMSLKQCDRYESVQLMIEDIERWMADEPVSVYREGWIEKSQRWLRKHRTFAQAGAISLLVIAMTASLAVYFVDKARRAESRAKGQERNAREITEAAAEFDITLQSASAFTSHDFDRLRNTVNRLLDLGAPGIETKLDALRFHIERHLAKLVSSERFDESAQGAFVAYVAEAMRCFTQEFGDQTPAWNKMRDDRLSQWNTVLKFDSSDSEHQDWPLALPTTVVLGDQKSLKRVAAGADMLLEVPLVEHPLWDIEWTVEFSHEWTKQSVIGLCMRFERPNAPDAGAGSQPIRTWSGYDFLLAVEGFDGRKRNLRDIEKLKLSTVEQQQNSQSASSLRMMILRDGEIMRSRAVEIAEGPLILSCKREGEHISFGASPVRGTGVVMDCFDPFAFATIDGSLGAVWPGGAAIAAAELRERKIARTSSVTERADILFSEGRYLDALNAYREIDSLEARYKLSLAYERTGDEAAYRRTLDEVVNASSSKIDDERWQNMAILKRLADETSAVSPEWNRIRENIKLFQSKASSRMFAYLPQVERDLVLQELMKAGLRYRLAFQSKFDQQLVEARNELTQELMEDDAVVRNMLWRTADIYRMNNKYQDAEAILRALVDDRKFVDGGVGGTFATSLSNRDKRILLADYTWFLGAEMNLPFEAIDEINRHLPDSNASDRRFDALLVERSRLYFILFKNETEKGNYLEAKSYLVKVRSDLEVFFRVASSIPDLTYFEWSAAKLLLGLLELESAKLAESDMPAARQNALKHWRQAQRRNWPQGPLLLNDVRKLVGAEGVLSTLELANEGLTFGFTKEVTSDEVDRTIRNYFPGSGLSTTVGVGMLNAALSPKGGRFGQLSKDDFFKRLLTELYDSSEGQKLVEQMILRSCSLRYFQREPLFHILHAAIQLSGFDDTDYPPEIEKVIWTQLRLLVDRWDNASADNPGMDEAGMEAILRIFSGNYSDASWKKLQPQFGPQLSASAAYVFGRMYLRRNELDRAESFFRFAVDSPDALPEFRDAARKELEQIFLK